MNTIEERKLDQQSRLLANTLALSFVQTRPEHGLAKSSLEHIKSLLPPNSEVPDTLFMQRVQAHLLQIHGIHLIKMETHWRYLRASKGGRYLPVITSHRPNWNCVR